MAFTPTLMAFSPKIASLLLRLPFPVHLKSGFMTAQAPSQKISKHVIIVGFGISGRNLARSCREAHIPYVILEMNAETVRKEKQKGELIFFGDASHDSVLHHAGIMDAKAIAILINDRSAAGRIVENSHKLNPKAAVVVRTRYLNELKTMYTLGADEVIPDEFGSSVEVLTRVLKLYQVPTDEVQKIVSDMRIEGYEMMRFLYQEPMTLADLKITLSDILIEIFRVKPGSMLAGKTLGECNLRKNYGVTAMLVRRGDLTITQMDAQTRLEAHDAVVLTGPREHILKVSTCFKSGEGVS